MYTCMLLAPPQQGYRVQADSTPGCYPNDHSKVTYNEVPNKEHWWWDTKVRVRDRVAGTLTSTLIIQAQVTLAPTQGLALRPILTLTR